MLSFLPVLQTITHLCTNSTQSTYNPLLSQLLSVHALCLPPGHTAGPVQGQDLKDGTNKGSDMQDM